MASNTTRQNRRQKFSVDTGALNAWSVPQKVTRLGESGLLSRSVIRAPAGSATTLAEILVWQGKGYSTATDPATVPVEDMLLWRNAITVVGNAVTADDDYDILAAHNGIGYDVRGNQEDVWVAIKNTGGLAQTGVVVGLEAIDTL